MASKYKKSINNYTTNQHEPARTKKKLLTASSWYSWLIFLLLLVSCQSTPKIPSVNLETTASLPFENGAFVYIFADTKRARSIIDLLPIEELNNKEIKQMLDKTRFFIAALFPKESGRRFQIAAQGNYPSSNAVFAMSLNKDWQKRRSGSGINYWHSPSNKVSVLLGANYAYAAASLTDKPFEPFTPKPGVQIPEEFNEFRKDSPLSCWIANPFALLNRMFKGLPVQSVKNLFLTLTPAPEKKYEVLIRLQFENQSHAKGLATILTFASGFSSEALNLFLANLPVVNGNNVDIKTAPLSEKEIKSLLELLL